MLLPSEDQPVSPLPSTDLEVGLVLNTIDAFGDGPLDVREAATRAERFGFSSLWAGDHLAFHAPILEGVVVLSAAAAVTTRTKLGFAVALPALRGSAWFAKQLTSLQVLAGDRLLLGVGVGGENAEEWAAAGVARSERGQRTDAFLNAVPHLLGGAPASVGPPEDLDIPSLEPHGSVPPIWVGGRSEPALRRAAQYAEVWLSVFMRPQSLERAYAQLERLAAENDRAAPLLGMSVLVHVTPSPRPHQTAEEIEGFLQGSYRATTEQMGKYVVSGDIDSVVSQLQAFVTAGARRLLLIPANRHPVQSYEALARVRAELES